jgi:hypothetical protein
LLDLFALSREEEEEKQQEVSLCFFHASNILDLELCLSVSVSAVLLSTRSGVRWRDYCNLVFLSLLVWSGLLCPLSGGWCNAGSGAGSRDECGGAGEMVSGCHGTRPAPCFLHAPRSRCKQHPGCAQVLSTDVIRAEDIQIVTAEIL